MLAALLDRTAPPQKPGEEVKLLYASQIGIAPPTFAIVTNRPDDVPESYQRYLANGFREAWPFTGSPLRLAFTSRGVAAVTSAAAPWLLASYLLGAIPTSYLAARLFRGIDLREHGSRNLGATNLYRVLGWRFAIPVGLFDAAKGAIPVLVFAPRISPSQLVALLCGVVAIVGHVFSVFVRFRGGKGVATAAGVMLALTPAALGVAALVWAVLVVSHGLRLARQHRGRGGVSGGRVPARAARPAGDPLGGRRWSRRRSSGSIAPTSSACSTGPRTGSAGARLRPRTRDPHRGPGRGQLGHHPGQPAGGQGRRRSGSGPSSRRWPTRSTGRTRIRCSSRASALAPALRATGDAGRGGARRRGRRRRLRRAMRCARSSTPLAGGGAGRHAGGQRHQGHRGRVAGPDVAGVRRVPAAGALRGAERPQLRGGGLPGAAHRGGGRRRTRRRRATRRRCSRPRASGSTRNRT